MSVRGGSPDLADRKPPTRGESERDAVRSYLALVLADLHARQVDSAAITSPEGVAEQMIALQLSRPFSYLSRSRAAQYEARIRHHVVRSVDHDEAVPYFFDIGGGYHASLRPGVTPPSFDVGLAELLVLWQIVRFDRLVRRFYPRGVRFGLVIDNVCALLVNDIPLAQTGEYCRRLRSLIAELDLATLVSVLVEAEHFSPMAIESRAQPAAIRDDEFSDQRHRNVERFLGRECSAAEAMQREARYRAIVDASDGAIEEIIDGIRMTQRASASTVCFRPFPGGASRIQCGEVALELVRDRADIRPFLLTSTNLDRFDLVRHEFPEVLPRAIDAVTVALASNAAAVEQQSDDERA